MSVTVKWFGQPVEEVIANLQAQVFKAAEIIETQRRDTNAVITIRANVNNDKLSDKEFRELANSVL